MLIDEDIEAAIEGVLDRIRPALALDGGDVRLVLVTWPDIELELVGSCSSCSSAPMTFRYGIVDELRRTVPGLRRVTSRDAIDELDKRAAVAGYRTPGSSAVVPTGESTATAVRLTARRQGER